MSVINSDSIPPNSWSARFVNGLWRSGVQLCKHFSSMPYEVLYIEEKVDKSAGSLFSSDSLFCLRPEADASREVLEGAEVAKKGENDQEKIDTRERKREDKSHNFYNASSNAEFLKKRIEWLQQNRTLTWQDETIKLIAQERMDIPSLEMNRLSDLGVINQGIQNRLVSATRWTQNSSEVSVMIARALEIQRVYQATHHVFIHAQSSKLIIFPDLIKEFMKIFYPQSDFSSFEFLRIPKLLRIEKNITTYSYANTEVCDHEKQTQEDLISANGNFYNNAGGESAIFFMSENTNISSPSLDLLTKVFKSFYPELSDEQMQFYSNRVIEVSQRDSSKIGNLFVVCIPKEKSLALQYLSHPFGRPCKRCTEEEQISFLEQLQLGNLSETAAECKINCSDNYHQYRLFTPRLTQENGVKIHLIPADRRSREEIQEGIRAIVQEIANTHWNDRFPSPSENLFNSKSYWY